MDGSRKEMKQQLLDLGIAPEKIIVYDGMISSGIIHIPAIEEAFS